ncbi:urease accessory protein UreF [Helicobacter sp. 12S02232-10]|uniref:urease accessory protein UreF n=1 Tax=Helicobacter sp. 12S02232-10 TaxID=1476197 RepID=UPI000BA744D4|nr:urease accessory protein UreF [Helicobacter sp. 12S02232-10]PAF47469.1 urease accessory protein UreF [Helicobacter sp. 12S02232-10]
MNKDFLLLQINDALFPIGSYTHSFGLETYIQMHLVKDAQSALKYLQANLSTQFLYTELLSLKLTHQYTQTQDLDKILDIERLICISTSPMELRSANQKLGNRFLKTIKILSLSPKDFFHKYLESANIPTHSSAYGVFCACMELDLKTAVRHYLYAQSSNMVTNCVKTIPLSQNDGQKILLELQKTFEEILQKLDSLNEKHLCASSIHNDIKAMQHETLYSRLYMS